MIHRGEQGFDAIHDEPSEADGGGLGYELRAARPQSGRRPIRPHIVVAKRIVAERPQQPSGHVGDHTGRSAAVYLELSCGDYRGDLVRLSGQHD